MVIWWTLAGAIPISGYQAKTGCRLGMAITPSGYVSQNPLCTPYSVTGWVVLQMGASPTLNALAHARCWSVFRATPRKVVWFRLMRVSCVVSGHNANPGPMFKSSPRLALVRAEPRP